VTSFTLIGVLERYGRAYGPHFEDKILEDFNMYSSPWRPDTLH